LLRDRPVFAFSSGICQITVALIAARLKGIPDLKVAIEVRVATEDHVAASFVYNRMPVILDEADWPKWLGEERNKLLRVSVLGSLNPFGRSAVTPIADIDRRLTRQYWLPLLIRRVCTSVGQLHVHARPRRGPLTLLAYANFETGLNLHKRQLLSRDWMELRKLNGTAS
jgi:hypothetical protein